jgi:hypothetical protein
VFMHKKERIERNNASPQFIWNQTSPKTIK